MLRTSGIVCTKDRFDDLRIALSSIMSQTVQLDELIIVDGGQEDYRIKAFLEKCPDAAVRYFRTKPGLTLQRNFGVRKATGDVIFFFDDDVVLDPDYLHEVIAVFENDSLGKIDGTTGNITNRERLSCPRRFVRALFLLPTGRGGTLPSGEADLPYSPVGIKPVSVLSGCNMAFRKSIFSDFSFDENIAGYGLAEDVDFSFRVSRKSQLIQVASAKLVHNTSNASRDSYEKFCYMVGFNLSYVFRKNMPRTIFHYLCFWWSRLGRLLLILSKSYRCRSLSPAKAYLAGLANFWLDAYDKMQAS